LIAAMIVLPRVLPPDVRALFNKQLEDVPLDSAIGPISGVVLRLFNAKELLFFLHRPTQPDQDQAVFRSVLSANPEFPKTVLEDFSQRWCEAKIDEAVCRVLNARLSAASYSAFSWPFAALADDHGLALPRDFTLFIPVSSELSVIHDSEPDFLGYFVLFFDSFPSFTENIIQLIVTLPSVLSDIILSYLRYEVRDGAGELSAFAHDMKRNLLLAEEQLLSLRSWVRPGQAERWNQLERNLRRMIQQTSAILLADKVQFQNLHISSLPININELVQETVVNFQPQFSNSKVELKIDLAEDLPLSPIDPAVFPTVIENLLDNSLKYSSAGGCVMLRTKRGHDDAVRLEIMDNGCGLSEDEWEQIFHKHYRSNLSSRSEGNGLGLYLVRKIVEAHHGRVFPEKTDEMKTCFVVELPAMFDSAEGAVP
jgi:signal transduction histidine kinase